MSRRLPVLVPGVFALAAGLWAGLARIGWPWPPPRPEWVGLHGPLMVAGFLGTLIGLERAVALRRAWGYAAPVLTGLAVAVLLLGVPGGPALLALGSVVFAAVTATFLRRQQADFLVIGLLGALAWVWAQGIWWATGRIAPAVPGWIAFLVLTIVAERLELSRLARPPDWARREFGAWAAVLILGVVWSAPGAWRGLGLGMLGFASWLWRYDLARRTVGQPGLPRFVAVCLLLGYGWLAAAGGWSLLAPPSGAGPGYDAVLHAVFLGFVFSMIFGHAPIILPAVLGIPIRFGRVLYVPLWVLHGGLGLRVIGDLLDQPMSRRWGALLSVVAMVGYAAGAVWCSSGGGEPVEPRFRKPDQRT